MINGTHYIHSVSRLEFYNLKGPEYDTLKTYFRISGFKGLFLLCLMYSKIMAWIYLSEYPEKGFVMDTLMAFCISRWILKHFCLINPQERALK